MMIPHSDQQTPIGSVAEFDKLKNAIRVQVRRARSPARLSRPLTAAALLQEHEKDENHHAARSAGRRIVAGSLYCLDGNPDKEAWLQDFTTLFEGHWNPIDLPFPAKDGKQFLAGEQGLHMHEISAQSADPVQSHSC